MGTRFACAFEQKKYRAVFEYLMGRDLPSRATDVYSVKVKGLSNSVLRELLAELEKIGFGRFINGRSFNWDGFDLRAIGRIAISAKEFRMSLAGLYRADYDHKSELENKRIRDAIANSSLNAMELKIKDLSQLSEEELVAALEAKGLEVFIRKKPKKPIA